MNPFKRISLCICLILSTLLLTACGQKGALYLPEEAEEREARRDWLP